MKKYLFTILAAAMAMVACSDDNNGHDNEDNIVVDDPAKLEQTVWADENEGQSGVTFSTNGAWTSSITEKTASRAAADWVSISPDHGDAAGKYTVQIILGTNYSGAERKAEIAINCGGQTIRINITQDAKTEEGEVPVDDTRYVSKVTHSEDGATTVTEFGYDTANRIDKITVTIKDGDETDEAIMILSYESGKISYTFTDTQEDEEDGEEVEQVGSAVLTLNNDGYVAGAVFESTWGTSGTTTPTYTNGYLTGVKGYIVEEGDRVDFTQELGWTSNNMTDYKTSWGENTDEVELQYSATSNNPQVNLDLNWLFAGTEALVFVAEGGSSAHTTYPFAMGLYGKRSDKMVSKITTTVESDGTQTYEYTYTPDKDGLITEVEIKEHRSYPNSGNEFTYYSTYKVEYR